MVRRTACVLALTLAMIPAKALSAQQPGGTPPGTAAPATATPASSAPPPQAPSAAPLAAPSTVTTSTPAKPAAVPHGPIVPGSISKTDRERALGILDTVVKGIQENYYDPKTNGVNWDVVVTNARGKITEANSLNGALAQVAAAVDTLNDSHTTFFRPTGPTNSISVCSIR